MLGYYKKPEETANAIDSDGWLHNGNVCTMREEGTIRFMGRYKDLLKVGGENVDPAEVEEFLLSLGKSLTGELCSLAAGILPIMG